MVPQQPMLNGLYVQPLVHEKKIKAESVYYHPMQDKDQNHHYG